MTNNIALTFNDLFSIPAQTLTYSIIKNNPELDLKFFYVIDPYFNEDKKKTLEQNLKIFKQNFSKFDFQILPMPQKLDRYLIEKYNDYSFSRFSIYRCFFDQVLPKDVNSVLYLDCDAICDGKLDELFEYYAQYQVEKANNQKIIFACSDILWQHRKKFREENHLKDYFNGGTLLINLKNWRNNQKFQTQLLEEVDKNPFWGDQDALNLACHNDLYQNISRIYNYYYVYDIIDPKPDPRIYVYSGDYPLKKRSNLALWKKIAYALKFDTIYMFTRNFLFNTLLHQNNYDFKVEKLEWSPPVRQKARKTFFKYYDPYLELVNSKI